LIFAVAIPINAEGDSVSVVDFVQTFNAQVDDAFAPDPSFRKKVRKPMINIFKKRGWGLTDEQQVRICVLVKILFSQSNYWLQYEQANDRV
jgi:hypothetical protein